MARTSASMDLPWRVAINASKTAGLLATIDYAERQQ
jgi:hypothetical protein